MTTPPILFLTFNRLDTTRIVFQSIRAAKPARLYVASDGARNDRKNEENIVSEVRDFVIQNIDWDCEVKTLFREENLGCGRGVSGAITWFFEHEKMGIVLEDDCLPDPSFFPYCAELLEKYELDHRVMMISGTHHHDVSFENGASYGFISKSQVWGWASWRRAWQLYDFEMKSWPNLKNGGFLDYHYPSSASKKHFEIEMDRVYTRSLDTWDYQWDFTMLSNHGLNIIPVTNMIQNIGFGEFATHTFDEDWRSNIKGSEIKFPLKHPNRIGIDYRCDSIYKYQISRFKGALKGFAGRLKRLFV